MCVVGSGSVSGCLNLTTLCHIFRTVIIVDGARVTVRMVLMSASCAVSLFTNKARKISKGQTSRPKEAVIFTRYTCLYTCSPNKIRQQQSRLETTRWQNCLL